MRSYGMTPAAEPADEPVGERRRHDVEHRERARRAERIHLGTRAPYAPGDCARHLIDVLTGTEPADGVPEVARHRIVELGPGRNGIHARDVDRRPRELAAQRLGQARLRGLRRAISAHEGNAAARYDRRDENQVAGILRAEERERGPRAEERA